MANGAIIMSEWPKSRHQNFGTRIKPESNMPKPNLLTSQLDYLPSSICDHRLYNKSYRHRKLNKRILTWVTIYKLNHQPKRQTNRLYNIYSHLISFWLIQQGTSNQNAYLERRNRCTRINNGWFSI